MKYGEDCSKIFQNLVILINVPQYPGYELLSALGALNSKHHIMTLGPCRGALSSSEGYTIKNKK